jgi:hypothetical protein
MKLFAGWVASAGLILAAWGANAQMLAPYDAGRARYQSASDFDAPYGEPFSTPAPPSYGYAPNFGYGWDYDDGGRPHYGYGPPLMPPEQVYAVLRENGFSPLGIPHQRGFFYEIAVVDSGGEGGRLIIDARNGRIVRFMPAFGWGRAYDRLGSLPDAAPGLPGPPPMMTAVRGVPRPPASVPHVTSRTVPMPSPKPAIAGKPQEVTRQSAAAEAKPANSASPSPAPQPSATVGEARPAPQILPTQKMPAVQALE